MASNADEWEDIPSSDSEWEDVPNAAPTYADPAKAKIANRVGPPTDADIAVMRDILALTGVGYAASQVPVAAPIMERAIRYASPDEYERMELGKARYEQENPKMSTALSLAAPMALPMGPAKLGAQMAYQGATSAADTLLKGGDVGDAAGGGVLTSGLTGVMGKAGKAVAPYLRRGGSAFDKVGEKVADYLSNKAAKRASDSVLAGQKPLMAELGKEGQQNVGRSLVKAGLMDKRLGQHPSDLAPRVEAATRQANDEITRLVDEITAEGVHKPSKTMLLNRIDELAAKKPATPDTKPYHNYLDGQRSYIESIPEDQLTLRHVQDLKNNVPYERFADTMSDKGRNAYRGALQDTQDAVVDGTGRKAEYKGMQKHASGLISASKGAEERAARFAANRNLSLSDYLSSGAGIAAGTAMGSRGGEDVPGGALGGALGGAALGAMNRYGRTKGSSAMAANYNSLSKMFRTKFGPMLEDAARRGKGGIGVAHYLMYAKNPEYRMLYDSQDGDNP